MVSKLSISLDRLVTSRCLLCNGSARGRKPFCPGCEQALPHQPAACRGCAMPLAADTLCGDCLQHPLPFSRVHCVYRYETPVSGLLNRFKHHGQLACGHWLAHGLAGSLEQAYRDGSLPECLMPVPLHWRRLRQRGFNQSLEISRVLSRQLGLPISHALQRCRQTDSQQGQGRTQRQRNLAGAFRLKRPLPFRSVALVDDVLTTGSTAAEITQVLHAAGINEVHVWAIARTP